MAPKDDEYNFEYNFRVFVDRGDIGLICPKQGDDRPGRPHLVGHLCSAIRYYEVEITGAQRAGKGDSPLLRQGDLVVDLAAKCVWRGKNVINLTPTEFKLLVALMRHAGEVVSPQMLVHEVWGDQYATDVGYVCRYVWHLRKKLEPDPDNLQYIHNEHGYGYRFSALSRPAAAVTGNCL